MSFSPFFSPHVFGLDSIRFTPREMTPAEQQRLTPAALTYSLPSSAIQYAPEIMSSIKSNRTKGPSPRVVFKDQLVQLSSAQSANSHGQVSFSSVYTLTPLNHLVLSSNQPLLGVFAVSVRE